MSVVIYAIQNPVYKPAMRVIYSITKAFPAVVTTAVATNNFNVLVPANHNYITGTIVRLDIPPGYGMTQADQKTGTITVTGPTTFTIDIDTTFFDAFVAPVTFPENQQLGQVIPIGENNSILTASTVNVLPY